MHAVSPDRRRGPAIASLPMYALPAVAAPIAAWWRGIARHLARHGIEDVPAALHAPGDLHVHWPNPDLLFSQTCGGPLVTELGDAVRVVGTPAYDSSDADGYRYRSVFIAREGWRAGSLADLKGARFAFNDRRSYSGFHAPRHALIGVAEPGEPFFGETVVTGSHLVSLEAVSNGRADCAAIDGVTLALVKRHMPDLCRKLREIARTAFAPGLPYIARGSTSDRNLERIRRAIEDAFADPALAEARRAQSLSDFHRTTHADYEPMKTLIRESRAVAIGRDGADESSVFA